MLLFHSFPVRPSRLRTESLHGYVRRFYGANGRNIPAILSGNILQIYRHKYAAQRQFNLLEKLVSGAERLDQNLWIDQWFLGSVTPQSDYLSLASPTLKFCPICLKSYGYWLLPWDLPMVHACPIHRCMLSSQCPRCKQTLTWQRLKHRPDWICHCGMPLAKMATTRASNAHVELTRFICHTTSSPCPSCYIFSGYGGGFRQPSNMGAYLTILLLQDIRKHFCKQHAVGLMRRKNMIYVANDPHKKVLSVPPVFFDWPQKFIAWLELLIAGGGLGISGHPPQRGVNEARGRIFLEKLARYYQDRFPIQLPAVEEILKFLYSDNPRAPPSGQTGDAVLASEVQANSWTTT